MSGRIDLKSVRLKTAQKYSNWLLFYLFFQKQAPFSVLSYTRSCHHTDGEHEDEVEEERQIARQTIDEADGKRTAGNLHHRTREMDGGTERNGEAGNAVGNPVFQGLLQCYRNGGCRRRGAESREVGWEHIEQQLKRILV